MSKHWGEEDFLTYVDARVGATERARLETHLAECPACRQQVEELRALRSVLEEWKPVTASVGFDARLRARLEQERLAEEQSRRRGWFVLRPAYAAALALAVLLALIVSLRPPVAPVVSKTEPGKPAAAVSAPSQAPEEVEEPSAAPVRDEDLAVLEDPMLMENYELLQEFDVLFDPLEKEEGKTL